MFLWLFQKSVVKMYYIDVIRDIDPCVGVYIDSGVSLYVCNIY